MPPPKQCGIAIHDNATQTRHDEERHQGHKSRSRHDPPRMTSNRDRREASQEGNNKKDNPPPPPPPSPPSSHHGGGGPHHSRSPSPIDKKKKNPEPYDARSRIDKIHKAHQAVTMAEEARIIHAAHPLLTRRRRTRSRTMHVRGSIRSTRPGKDHTWDHVVLELQYGPQLTPKVSGSTRPSSPMTPGTTLFWNCNTVRNLPQRFPDRQDHQAL